MKSILLIIFLIPLTVIGQNLGEGKWIYDSIGGVYRPETTLPNVSYNTFLIMHNHKVNYDTIPCIMLVSDSSIPNNNKVVWIKGWEVREKHNTSEGVMDAFGTTCVDKSGNIIPCYSDYFKHIEYLDIIKNKLNKNIIVWQSKNN